MSRKYKVLLLIEFLCLLPAIFLCFHKEEQIYFQSGENIMSQTEDGIWNSERMRLTPGVYQMRISGQIPEGCESYFTLSCDTGTFQALRCNGALMYQGQETLDFEAYVVDTVDFAYLQCQLKEGACVFSVSLYRTNWGGRILCFCILAGSLLLNILLLFRDGILAEKISKEKQFVVWVLLAGIAVAYFPFAVDYYSLQADSAFHMLRIEGLKETLLAGERFPVRVQSYWLYDHGYAVSTFCSDLFLLIPVLFRIIGFSLMTSYKLFVLLVMAATAGIAYYSFKKCTGNIYAALFGSVIYLLAPYRIYIFYNRGAVGEYLGMTFLPLVLCGMYRLYTENVENPSYKKAKVPLVIGLSCILQSHLLTCEIATAYILLIGILLWKKTFRKKTILQLAEAAGICLLINCWFWVPLLVMMGKDQYGLNDLVHQEFQNLTSLSGILQLYPNMGGAQTGMYHCEPIQVGAGSLLLLCLFLLTFAANRMVKGERSKYENPYDKVSMLFAVLSLVSLFLSTRYFPWNFLEAVPGIKYQVRFLQFSTWLMPLATVFCAMFAAFFVMWFKEEIRLLPGKEEEKQLIKKGVLLFAGLITAGSAVYHVNDIAYQGNVTRLYTAENLGTISVGNGEYLLTGTQVSDYYYHGPVSEEGLEWSAYEKKGLQISLFVENTTEEELYLELPVIGYRGYGLTSDEAEQESPYITKERGNHGDLRVAVPAGYKGSLNISYKGFFIYRIAETLSLGTLLCIAAYLIADVGRNRKRKKTPGKEKL